MKYRGHLPMKQLNIETAIGMVMALFFSWVILFSSQPVAAADTADQKTGEALFTKHCASCHPNGGNILNPKRTLSRQDRHAYNIITAEDIVYKMRNSGPAPTHSGTWSGMKLFDEKTISHDDALKIADYIMQTFP